MEAVLAIVTPGQTETKLNAPSKIQTQARKSITQFTHDSNTDLVLGGLEMNFVFRGLYLAD